MMQNLLEVTSCNKKVCYGANNTLNFFRVYFTHKLNSSCV